MTTTLKAVAGRLTTEAAAKAGYEYIKELNRRRAVVVRMDEEIATAQAEVKSLQENRKMAATELEAWLRMGDEAQEQLQLSLFTSG